jgi:hypothetical protein
MIAEAAIAGVTVCFVDCLRFTRYVLKWHDPFAEKRRVLERKYNLHQRNAKYETGTKPTEHHKGHSKERDKTEKQLLELADEEKAWRSQ